MHSNQIDGAKVRSKDQGDSSEDFSIMVMVERTRSIVTSQSAFQIGKHLHELEEQLSALDVNISDIINRVGIKGKRRATLISFMRLYRIFRNFPEKEMNRLSDPLARELSKVYGGYVLANNDLKEDGFYISPEQALERALSGKVSGEALQKMISNRMSSVNAFANEREIEKWFDETGDRFFEAQRVTLLFKSAAAGPALGDIDYICQKADDPGVLVVLDLKDAVGYQDVGQSLGQRNELLEHRKNGEAYLFREYKNKRVKFSTPLAVTCHSVEAWLIGQTFHESAYYAAKGQELCLFRITSDEKIIGPCHAGSLTRPQWLEFTGAW